MKIKDLKQSYPEAYERALKNQEEFKGLKDENMFLITSFDWRTSIEGGEYWACIDNNYLNEAKQILKEKQTNK